MVCKRFTRYEWRHYEALNSPPRWLVGGGTPRRYEHACTKGRVGYTKRRRHRRCLSAGERPCKYCDDGDCNRLRSSRPHGVAEEDKDHAATSYGHRIADTPNLFLRQRSSNPGGKDRQPSFYIWSTLLTEAPTSFTPEMKRWIRLARVLQ